MIAIVQEKLAKLFIRRLPDGKSIWGVYAVIVFLVYSWTLITSFYKLPSWMFYLTIDQILSMYAYFFSVNFAESILLLAGVFLLEFTLFFELKNNKEFQPRSVLLVIIFLTSLMLRLILFQSYEDSDGFVRGELMWWAITIPTGLILAVAGSKIKWLRNVLEGISDRLVVFLYIYLSLSLLSLITVLFRNIQ